MMAGLSAETQTSALGTALAALQGLLDSANAIDEALLKAYQQGLGEVAMLASESGYTGLESICLLFQDYLDRVSVQETALTEALRDWPALVLRYLNPSEPETCIEALLAHLQQALWEPPLLPEDAAVLRELLIAERPRPPEETQVSQQAAEQKDSGGKGSAQVPPAVAELIPVLLEEVPLLHEALERFLKTWQSTEGDPAALSESVEDCSEDFHRFAEALESLGFQGLAQVIQQLCSNLETLATTQAPYSPALGKLLAEWRELVQAYLNDPYAPAASQGLRRWLEQEAWPLPLREEQAQALEDLLLAPDFSELEAQEAEQPTRSLEATPEAVSLEIPEDVNPELLKALLQELPVPSRTLSEAMLKLSNGQGSLETIRVAQRMAHTLKGAGNTVGVRGIANLAHQMEDILSALSKAEKLPAPPLAQSLLNAADCLEAMGEALRGLGDPPENAQAVLQEILDWANRIEREGLPEEAISHTAPPAEPEGAEMSSPAAPQEAAPSQPVSVDLIDRLLRQGGESMIQGAQIQELVRQIDERMQMMHQAFKRLQQLGDDLERLIEIEDLNVHQSLGEQFSEFDALEMDQYNELHTTSRMLVEAATDAQQIGAVIDDQLQQLENLLLVQERLHRETQELVFSARMVPIGTIAPRLQRSVRQTCRMTGKQADLQLSGMDTLMDSTVLNELLHALMHILRNAVDHGIEPPEVRVAQGKPPTGIIQLDFQREGNSIRVRCQDDGAGFDYAAIRQAAERQGLLEPGQEVTEEMLHHFLLQPNFTTREKVTQTSGRGVGLDVVYNQVVAQGGSLRLKSEAGKGTQIELRIPVSLISTHALLVGVQDRVVAISDRGIERILHPSDGEQRTLGGQRMLRLGEQFYPLKDLETALRLPPATPSDNKPILLVRTRSGINGVLVQEVRTGTDLVIKEFGPYVPRVRGLLGATILGDGTVTPVLDLPELIAHAQSSPVQVEIPSQAESDSAASDQPLALVVDDSLSARRALVEVLEDAGYAVQVARDGMEAVQVIETKRPQIVLTDLEMPRMNGIELATHLRAHRETADVPMIMITSRSTEKHRRRALEAGINAYLTKPFSEDQLFTEIERLLQGAA